MSGFYFFTKMINQEILLFFENIPKYYGSVTEITETFCEDANHFDKNNSTWNLSEFILVRSGYRKAGGRFMIEGQKMYVEISAQNIVSVDQLGRNHFRFIEQYGNGFFRILKIRFQYKY